MPTLPLGRIRPWSSAWRGLLCLLCLACWGTFVTAQEEAAPPPEPDAAQAPAPVPEPAPAPVPAPVAAPTEESGVTTAAPRTKSGLQWIIDSSGPIGFVLLLMSVTLTAMVIRLFLEFRLKEAVPPPLVDRLDAAIKDRKFQEAYDICRDDPSFLARLVRTGVANMPNGRTEAKEAMSATAEEIIVGMESKNSYLGTIGTLAPMVGLLGTVLGMILAFRNLATVEGVQVDPSRLADNISLALVTTFEGLIVAVPAIFFFAFFRNRIVYIGTETTKIAERIINTFWQAAKHQPAVKSNT